MFYLLTLYALPPLRKAQKKITDAARACARAALRRLTPLRERSFWRVCAGRRARYVRWRTPARSFVAFGLHLALLIFRSPARVRPAAPLVCARFRAGCRPLPSFVARVSDALELAESIAGGARALSSSAGRVHSRRALPVAASASASLFFRPSQRACYMPSLAANPRSTRASGRLSPVGCASLLSSALAPSSRRCRYHCRYHRKKKLHIDLEPNTKPKPDRRRSGRHPRLPPQGIRRSPSI